MGSLNSYPGQSSGLKRVNKKKTGKNRVSTISLLINAVFYWLECVFIFHRQDYYRLVVLEFKQKQSSLDQRHKSLEDAKMAFEKLYRRKACNETVKPNWSHPYHPDEDWLDKKMKILNPPNN